MDPIQCLSHPSYRKVGLKLSVEQKEQEQSEMKRFDLDTEKSDIAQYTYIYICG